ASLALVAGLAGSSTRAQTPAPVVTPKGPDGHPVLDGFWVAGGPTLQNGFASNADGITFAGRGGTFGGFDEDRALNRMNDRTKPIYKPEFWPIIREADYNGNWQDPMQFCMPLGVPRLGAPARVVVLPKEVLLFYNGGFSRDTVRSIKLDVPHNPVNVALETWN